MTRETSIETYKQVEASGLLSSMRLLVYKYVSEHLGCTQRECLDDLPANTHNSVTTRFSELVRMGMIAERNERKTQNGHPSITYRITGRITPIPLPKRMTSAQKVALFIEAMSKILLTTSLKEAQGVASQVLSDTMELAGTSEELGQVYMQGPELDAVSAGPQFFYPKRK